jgi:AraC family transcriptional regulator
LAKIALNHRKITGPPAVKTLAEGEDWSVSDVVCGSGPSDRPFEEVHSRPTMAIVVSGTFQYRSRNGRELMTPGSLLLGSAGQSYECGHEHGTGDRCISFSCSPTFLERLASDVDASGKPGFRMLRLPPARILSPLIAKVSAAARDPGGTDWEELLTQVGLQVLELDRGFAPDTFRAEPGAVARVTRVVRTIERDPDSLHKLGNLASEARMSPYHFLRTFERITGITPHQYVLRARLQRAAIQLSRESTKIVDIALGCGFGDISNFTRTFRAEFGVSPRKYRIQMRRG